MPISKSRYCVLCQHCLQSIFESMCEWIQFSVLGWYYAKCFRLHYNSASQSVVTFLAVGDVHLTVIYNIDNLANYES